MDGHEAPDTRDAAFERELTMARGAILMVEAGASHTMTVGGLCHGRAVIDALRDEAGRHGVTLVSLPQRQGDGLDLRAERTLVDPVGR
jgi:hypothetical protein